MHNLRPLAASLLLLLLAPALAAQLTEKQAVAQVKAAAKSQLKVFNQVGAAALKTLGQDLGEYEGLLTSGSTPDAVDTSVANSVLPFVTAMDEAYAQALHAVDTSASQALDLLGTAPGAYPKDFCYGAGGVLDDDRAALGRAAAKFRDAAVKRLAKSSALTEKIANIALEVELRLPAFEAAETVDANLVQPLGESARLDLVVAASSLAALDDGVFTLAGSTSDVIDNVNVGFESMGGIAGSGGFPPDGDGRFVATLAGAPEGGCVAFAKQSGIIISTVAIGLR